MAISILMGLINSDFLFRTATCGATVSYNNSYVENPGYPKKFDTTLGTSPCEFKVSRMEGASKSDNH